MLKLRFRIHLENYEVHEFRRPKGALFNRWLPDGRANVIDVPVRHKDNKLQIWFERKGYVKDEFIEYDSQKSEVDPVVMARQGKLEAGPLRGEAVFYNVMDEEVKAVQGNHIGSEEYVALGKRVIDFLRPPLSNFISVLRTQYGQYWLRELEPWDSRRQSLGSYCRSTLGLFWCNDGNQWNHFSPTESSAALYVTKLPRRGFGEYLTKDDWEHLSSSFDPYETPSLATIILGKAHEFYDNGELKQSFVEGVTALEVALSEFVLRKLADEPQMSEDASRIFSDPSKGVQEKFKLVSLISSSVSNEIYKKTLEAIKIRNNIVHRGDNSSISDETALQALFHVITVFLSDDEYKFPVLINGNMLYAPEE